MFGIVNTYRRVIALTGPLLPLVSFFARLPVAMSQFGSVLLVAETSGSIATAAVVGGTLSGGQVVSGPVLGRLADRYGQRPVVLAAAAVNAVATAALVAGALGGLATVPLAAIGAVTGASAPLIGPLARTRSVALAHRARADEGVVGAVHSLEGTLDEVSFVLGPALVGLAAIVAHPAVALGGAAALVAVFGTAFALHPTAAVTAGTRAQARPDEGGTDEGGTDEASTQGRTGDTPARVRPPGVVYAVRGSLALQGAMFGACQAGIAALTIQLGVPEQAAVVYAAMGVVSAAVGLSLGALPARIGLRLRWRAATGAALVLSVPLLFTDTLGPLYAVVTVLGAAYAPHLITAFALTERAAEPARLAESMAFAASSLVAGQAISLAVSGRLAEWYGPSASFAVAVGAAALCLTLSLVTRVPAARTHAPAKAFVPARVAPSPAVPDREGAVVYAGR
ncbi:MULTISPECIES: MFS transporter [unclassified Streptomyces]|uniref:MFS transporter n=1 Tax=unclassified Streptomyces TaxID=2593676 RepID=UPI001BEB4A3F|nr:MULTISPECIES: MFS transporter [unclassified Streptomyces]MBT2405048.1 MFS transporter [Streptomyces sp. ISL-21]MBT2456186.1 MFS transporter [Streptomyces sp. ISL-86]MBT2610774.1 MFS transporter [Streptomyces sp. ISL-87]